jgi:diguanylate cyclase (GGDEF)-like protein
LKTSSNGFAAIAAPAPVTAQSRASDQRWPTVARLAAVGCGVAIGLVAMRRQRRFAIVGVAGLFEPAEHLHSEELFEQTMRRAGEIVEVSAAPDADMLSAMPFRHYAAVALIGSGGEEFGLIGVLGHEARHLTPEERESLLVLADGVRALLERASQAHELPQMADEAPEALVLRLFAASPEATVIYDRSLPNRTVRVLGANGAFSKFFGLMAPADGSSPLSELLGERSDRNVFTAIMDAASSGRPMRATLALYPKDQSEPRWMEMWGYAVSLASGRSLWIEQFHDVTERVQRHAASASDRVRLQRTLASMADAVITLDAEGRLRFMNNAARQLLDLRGVLPADHVLHADERLLQLRDVDTEEPLIEPFALAATNLEQTKARALVITRSGIRRYVEYAVSAIERPQGAPDGIVVILRDVTAEEVLTRRLSFEASHDQLTGIANRRRFDQALARALSSAKAESAQHTLAFMDLDRFKAINDSCGHAAGDQVLREVALLFKGQLRSHDVIARFGGDEFAILMHDCSPATARRVIERIRAAIAGYQWPWQGRAYTLDVSIGLAEITQATPDAEHILREADAACYADKAEHRLHVPSLETVVGDSGSHLAGATTEDVIAG